MSKKPQQQQQPTPKDNRPKEPAAEEENDPFLRTLQKKVRNINKKLTDIAQLELKENLKPEQVDKLNRKPALMEERARIEETATLFRESYLENAAIYRNTQLRELEALARAVAIFHSGGKVSRYDKLVHLWHTLEQSDKTYSTLNEAITSITATLKDIANDKNLQKELVAYAQEHGNTLIVNNQHQIVSEVLPEKEANPKPVDEVEASLPPKEEIPVGVQKTTVPVFDPVPVSVIEAKKKQIVESRLYLPMPDFAEPTTEVPFEYPAFRPYYGDYPERREYRDAPREKRQYRPKYVQKVEVPQKKEMESGNYDFEPEVRTFRKEEICSMEDDGSMITKAKPTEPHFGERSSNQRQK